ncbi:hypothetical protein Bca4012_008397 [Brassica carinata]
MVKENHEGENLPPELNQILEQIERERFLHIQKSFADRPSVVTQAAYHQSLASTRGAGVINDGGDNNMLSLRMKTPLHIFKYNPGKEFTSPIPKEQVIKLPIVKQLPRAITWLLTDSNKLMAESDSVIGKKQIIYVNGQAEELSSDDEEETEKEKLEFSKDANRFIWEVGQKHNLDDLVVRSALSKFFELDISVILERYNDLKKLKINEGDIGEVSDIRIFTCYPETTERRFCRRCLRFDCREHEEYQPEVYNKENHSILFEKEDVRKQCSNHCYLKLRGVTEADHLVDNDNSVSNKKGKNVISEMSQAYNEWTPVEIDLYLKGAKLFGRNRKKGSRISTTHHALASRYVEINALAFVMEIAILLGMSDVHGWGAYTRQPLKRNEFLGEYTGDLVSIDEAEERDRADDKLGYSYIFNLNDKFVIDSRRQGSKLRFLNHSTNPNCYAKLMIVKGDHKIGLFAAKTIREGEELVFEYKQGEADPFPSNSGGSSS